MSNCLSRINEAYEYLMSDELFFVRFRVLYVMKKKQRTASNAYVMPAFSYVVCYASVDKDY